MNNIIKRSIGLIIAVILALAPFNLFDSSSAFVSASSGLYPDKFETGYFNSSNNIVNALNSALDALDVNQSIFLDDYYVFISNYSLYGFGSVFLLDKNNTSVSNNGYADTYFSSRYYSFFISYTGIQFRSTVTSNVIDFSSISSIDFNSFNYNSSYKVSVGCPFSWQNAYGLIYDGTDTVSDSWYLNRNYNALIYDYCLSFTPPFNSTSEEVQLPFFSLDVDDFYTWLVNNDKIDVSGGSGGISVTGKIPSYIGVQKLKSFLQFYKSYGSSNQSFVKNIVKWFSFMNIVGQSKDNINILKNTIDSLYNEYINYRSGTHAYWPGATKIQERDTIDTKTDNNNLTLVTDDNDDPLDISILRDILRGVIAISNNVNQGCANIVQKLDELNFIVNVVNDGGDNSPIDLSSLYVYDADAFANDLQNFEASVEDVQSVPQGYISTINQNALMPENMLEDKNSLTVNIPTITGFTVNNNGGSYSTQTGTHVLKSTDYPWLDPIVQKIKRFASIILILGYLVHLRYRIPELIRGE